MFWTWGVGRSDPPIPATCVPQSFRGHGRRHQREARCCGASRARSADL